MCVMKNDLTYYVGSSTINLLFMKSAAVMHIQEGQAGQAGGPPPLREKTPKRH